MSNRKSPDDYWYFCNLARSKVEKGQFPLTLKEYVMLRIGGIAPAVITKDEADLLGIEYPLPKGWLDYDRMIGVKTFRKLISVSKRGMALNKYLSMVTVKSDTPQPWEE